MNRCYRLVKLCLPVSIYWWIKVNWFGLQALDTWRASDVGILITGVLYLCCRYLEKMESEQTIDPDEQKDMEKELHIPVTLNL
jgi:hypothetical protein